MTITRCAVEVVPPVGADPGDGGVKVALEPAAGGAANASPGGAPASTLEKKAAQDACTDDGSARHARYISSAYTLLAPLRNDSDDRDGVVVDTGRNRGCRHGASARSVADGIASVDRVSRSMRPNENADEEEDDVSREGNKRGPTWKEGMTKKMR